MNALFSRADDIPYIQEVDTGLIAYMHGPLILHLLFIIIQYPVILPVWEDIDSLLIIGSFLLVEEKLCRLENYRKVLDFCVKLFALHSRENVTY